MDNASDLLTVVMGLENALMAVMRLDVVSYHPGRAMITVIAFTNCNKCRMLCLSDIGYIHLSLHSW